MGVWTSGTSGCLDLLTGSFDGLLVEQSCDILSDPLQDGNESVLCLHGRVLQKCTGWLVLSTCTREDRPPFV
jgi:hypothetical protein